MTAGATEKSLHSFIPCCAINFSIRRKINDAIWMLAHARWLSSDWWTLDGQTWKWRDWCRITTATGANLTRCDVHHLHNNNVQCRDKRFLATTPIFIACLLKRYKDWGRYSLS